MVQSYKGERNTRISKEGMRESRWRRVLRFRVANEIREGKYW